MMHQLLVQTLPVIVLINFAIAVYILFSSSQKTKVRVLFSFVCIEVALWSLINYITFVYSSNNIQTILFLDNSAMLPVIPLPFTFLLFAIFFTKRQLYKWNLFLLALPSLLMLPFVFTSLNINGYSGLPTYTHFIPGPLYIFFSIYFIIYMTWALYILIQEAHKTKSIIVKRQLAYIITGVIISSIITMFFSVILPLFGNSYLAIYGIISAIFFTGLTAYAITRYRFLNIRIILRKSLITFIILGISLVLVVSLVLILKNLFANYLPIPPDFFTLIAVVVLLFFFPKIKQTTKQLIDRYIFTDIIDFSAKLKEFEQSIHYIKLMSELAERSMALVQEAVKVSSLRFLAIDPGNKQRCICYFPSEDPLIIHLGDPIFQYAKAENEPFLTEELTLKYNKTDLEKRVIKRLTELKASIAVPLGKPNDWLGVLLIGPRPPEQAKTPFTTDEITYLRKTAISLTHVMPGVVSAQHIIEENMRLRREEEEAEAAEAAADIDDAATVV